MVNHTSDFMPFKKSAGVRLLDEAYYYIIAIGYRFKTKIGVIS